MINFKIYNDDRIRNWYNFPKLNDPYVLEGTLLRVINEYLYDNGNSMIDEFDIHNPFIANMYFTYYSSSNFNSWGELPLSYIYNDMVRHIQNQNTSNNFIITLESIFISKCNELNSADEFGVFQENYNIAYDIITSYISENYLNSYNYICHNNNSLLVAILPKADGLMAYIIATGFNPSSMAKWFCTSKSVDTQYSLPASRKISLIGIVKSKLGSSSRYNNTDISVNVEMSDSKTNSNIKNCITLINSYDISGLRKKSIYDTEIKYGNYPIDYNILRLYDSCIPAAHMLYTFKSGETLKLNRFNQPEYRVDYRLLKREEDIVNIANKRAIKK